MALLIEQTAVDGGQYGVGWLLAGLPQPPFHAVQQHTRRLQEEPLGELVVPRLAAAARSYLRDLDYFEQRQRVAVGGGP